LVELPVETDTPTPFPLWVELYDLAEGTRRAEVAAGE
jgi:hypothetical protein